MPTSALMIAAPRSGSGKTLITLSLLSALRKRKIPIRAAKSGPDYIDPTFHAKATSQTAFNLDSWAMPPAMITHLLASSCQNSQYLIIESSMGLFDGITATPGREGKGADLAAALGLPILLVLDVSGQAQSAAAIAYGFCHFDPALHIAGIILNQVASPRHEKSVRSAIEPLNIPIVGCFYRTSTLKLPERHLGLVQAEEHPHLDQFFQTAADLAEHYLDIETILSLARPLNYKEKDPPPPPNSFLPPPGQRIALARDAAFSFLYPHILESWREQGAELSFFSPLADEAIPTECDACWLPGGYPELHAEPIAQAQRFITSLQVFAQSNPIHGECGGYMVLGQTLTDAQGHTHPMAGLLDHHSSDHNRKMHLGYRQAITLAPTWAGKEKTILRGHEFHYAQCISRGQDSPFATLYDGAGLPLGPEGGQRGRVTGCFFHTIACTP
ncbi:cobyrinate a,c-diamide synthase [Entomobacter blattae]|uniref:Cobyrinate a,c-diamide synthase n=1 Tax=Entomobacter blattae TaxID=2762277 RepID=A0A7H1NQ18_9PROT|nr:cobyrinate a,c-diamide synthase [Entomobacter blattae]QNT77878.1 Hydrogenobyrinate a,c-diamide synthase [Entomobacter blattae]